MNAVVEPNKFEPQVPPAVARLAKAANDMQQEFINGGEPPVDPNAPPPPPPAGDPPVDPNEHPIGDPPIDPNTPPVPPGPAEDASWEQKYKTMQGRFNAEMPRLRSQVDQLNGQIVGLNKVLASVTAPPAAPVDPEPVAPLITDEERAAYGDDFVDFTTRVASQAVIQATQPLVQEIKELRSQVGGVGQVMHQTARDQLLADLTAEVPNWVELNRDPEFLAWLSLTDPYSGAIRQNLLSSAFEQNNFPQTAAFFKGFISETTATASLQPAEPAIPITPAKPTLESFAAPGRAKSAATTPPPKPPAETKKLYSRAQIANFFSEKISGKWRGREAAATAIEADIILAGAEGRVTG